ncbi:MAG: macro domain-containing protein [Bacillota bacterium]|nr:macro domain-containing protein [Bacillota bacterium]
MPFTIIRDDITHLAVDAIVNAANSDLLRGGGVCGSIFRAAGVKELEAACAPLAPVPTGEAVVTPGFALAATYVIHAVGPVYRGGHHGEAGLLASAYRRSLELARDLGLTSIAFPLISSGIYGYPKAEALRIARETITDFLLAEEHELQVTLVIFDRASYEVAAGLLDEVAAYIDDRYAARQHFQFGRQRQLRESPLLSMPVMRDSAAPETLDTVLGELAESFSGTLLRLIDASGRSDVEIYKRANLSRQLFSKIRSNPDYMPSKRTALALAIALELDLDATNDLLARAGYTLSNSRKSDVIVRYFIERGRYDLFTINELLFKYDEPLLGS